MVEFAFSPVKIAPTFSNGRACDIFPTLRGEEAVGGATVHQALKSIPPVALLFAKE
jgi:hypothetical protein